jgi:autotransporter passenger strand-loop-strand repeat protein
MTITVASGVISRGLTISSGDPLVVLSGGEIAASAILSGGSATISAGATASAVVVSAGGLLEGGGSLEGVFDDQF